MAKCNKCHKFKTRSVLSRHQKLCIPSRKDVMYFLISRGALTEDQKKERGYFNDTKKD